MQNHAQDAKGRGRPPKQRGDKLLTREMLVHVGTEVLTEKGYSAVGVDEILQRTGISRCSFYYYFKTKEGFGAELIDRWAASGPSSAKCGTRWRGPIAVPVVWSESWRRRSTRCRKTSVSSFPPSSRSGRMFSRAASNVPKRLEKYPRNWTAPLRRPSSGTAGRGPCSGPIWN